MRRTFYLCPASKAGGAAGEIPGPRDGAERGDGRFFLQAGGLHYINGTGRGGFLQAGGLHYINGTKGAVFLQAGGLHYINGAGRVKNAGKLFWNVVDVGYLHYLCLEIIK